MQTATNVVLKNNNTVARNIIWPVLIHYFNVSNYRHQLQDHRHHSILWYLNVYTEIAPLVVIKGFRDFSLLLLHASRLITKTEAP